MSADRVQTTSWIQKAVGVCGGEPCVRKTRHTVAGLVQWKKQGLPDERILRHHPDLTQADLDAAWDYYAAHHQEIDRAIDEDEKASPMADLYADEDFSHPVVEQIRGRGHDVLTAQEAAQADRAIEDEARTASFTTDHRANFSV